MSSSMFSYLVLWLPLWLSTKFSLLDQVPLLARISRKPAQPWNRPNSSRQRAPRAPLVWPLPSWSPFLWWLQSLVVLASWPTVKSKLGKYSSLFNWISTVSSQHPSTGSERLLQRNRWSLVSFKQLWFQGISSVVIYYYSCLYYYLLWVPIICIIIAADWTLYLYVSSVSPSHWYTLKKCLGGITNSARLYIAHSSKNS